MLDKAEAHLIRGRAYVKSEEYDRAYQEFISAGKEEAPFVASSAPAYIAARIERSGAGASARGDLFRAFYLLHEAIHRVKEELFYSLDEHGEKEVAHYSSLHALKKLVRSEEKFRMQNADHMNDPSEGRVFFDVLAGHDNTDYRSMFYPDLGAAVNEVSASSPAYIGSFVMVQPDGEGNKDRLSPWRTYGRHNDRDAGGACLLAGQGQFAPKCPAWFGAMPQVYIQTTKPSATDILPPATAVHVFGPKGDAGTTLQAFDNVVSAPSEKPALYRIAYKSDCAEEQDVKLFAALAELAGELRHVNATLNSKRNSSAGLNDLVREMLDDIRFLFKSDHYADEKEVRVVRMHYHPGESVPGKPVQVDGDGIPPRFYLQLERDFRFHEVILGGNVDRYAEWVRYLRHADADLEVMKSKIPFRR